MEKGTLVEFRLQGNRHLAVVDRPADKKGKNWIVIDERGQSHTLHPRQVTYAIAGQTFSPADIPEFCQSVDPYLDPSSLEVAWELLSEEGESADASEMALLLFSEQTSAHCYAAHCLLSEDKIFFKQKADRYEPRSQTQVAELQHQLEVEAQRQQDWQLFLERIRAALAGESVEWQQSDQLWLEALERFAILGDEANHRAPALDVLAELDYSKSAESAFQLLVDLGRWSPHENLSLRRSQLPTQFPPKVYEMVQQCLASPPPDPDPQRLDLTHLKTFTVDDESTREIDDGLSLEFLEDGRQRLWIHIADPTRWLTPGDDLDLEARRRCTTLYLPTGMIPMFPSELATGPMSLVQGKECCALSFGVILDEAGAISDYSIQTSIVKPTYRLTYEDVDEILQLGVRAEPELEALSNWATQRQSWRGTQGAISIRMPETSIKVDSDDEISIELLDNSPARQLVAEMMILAGEAAASYAQEHQIPIPFRNQPQPELPSEEELMLLPAGIVRDCAIRRCMTRSETSLVPSRHATLGLDPYTQVTSPIRRYTDLLTHFQIKAHLRGETLPFAAEEMQELLQGVGAGTYEAVLVERQTKRYWSLEFLRRYADQTWAAMMLRWLREHEGLAIVMLEELGLELIMRFDRPVEPGEHLHVKVNYANPRQDVIQLHEVENSLSQATA
ncbi:MAG: ribonuclease catalytic domain-containing protein [Thainema sp.]